MSHDHDEKDAKGELLPCPFCGGTPRLEDLAGWELGCECGAAHWARDGSREGAIAAWNTRADTARIVAERDALIEAGRMLSNMAFNLSQRKGETISQEWADSLRKGWQTWDDVRARSTQPDAPSPTATD